MPMPASIIHYATHRAETRPRLPRHAGFQNTPPDFPPPEAGAHVYLRTYAIEHMLTAASKRDGQTDIEDARLSDKDRHQRAGCY